MDTLLNNLPDNIEEIIIQEREEGELRRGTRINFDKNKRLLKKELITSGGYLLEGEIYSYNSNRIFEYYYWHPYFPEEFFKCLYCYDENNNIKEKMKYDMHDNELIEKYIYEHDAINNIYIEIVKNSKDEQQYKDITKEIIDNTKKIKIVEKYDELNLLNERYEYFYENGKCILEINYDKYYNHFEIVKYEYEGDRLILELIHQRNGMDIFKKYKYNNDKLISIVRTNDKSDVYYDSIEYMYDENDLIDKIIVIDQFHKKVIKQVIYSNYYRKDDMDRIHSYKEFNIESNSLY